MINRIILNETSYFGENAREVLVDEVKNRGYKRALLVSDESLKDAGVINKVTDLLDKNNIEYMVYSEVKPNPTVEIVKKGVEICKNYNADYIIALGGGSSIDTSKAIGIIITNPEFSDVVSLEGVANTKNKSLPIIALPTTAGTAAEVTINYVITDTENVKKMVCVDPHDIPVLSIIDTDLMSTMPKMLAASTGMDALTHAIEGYITLAHWTMTDMFHIKAIQMIFENLDKAVNLKDKEAINNMGVAQYIAGMGFSNVGLGIVHSMAHSLGALYDTPHGIANALLLPYVMEYNGEVSSDRYREILIALGHNVEGLNKEEIINKLVNLVKELSERVGISNGIKEVGVKEEDIPLLAEKAYNDVCTGGNPRKTSVEDIIEIYKRAY